MAENLDVRNLQINFSKDREEITTDFKFKQRLENDGHYKKYGMYYEIGQHSFERGDCHHNLSCGPICIRTSV